jgi:hypothetical protein
VANARHNQIGSFQDFGMICAGQLLLGQLLLRFTGFGNGERCAMLRSAGFDSSSVRAIVLRMTGSDLAGSDLAGSDLLGVD